jgi:hypothetical protein
VCWVPVERAAGMLTYARDAVLLEPGVTGA